MLLLMCLLILGGFGWRYSIHFYFTEITEIYQYTKCLGVETEQCSVMDDQVVVEGTPSELADYLVLEDGVGNQCCYVKQGPVPGPATGYTIVEPFTDCENLPAVCQ